MDNKVKSKATAAPIVSDKPDKPEGLRPTTERKTDCILCLSKDTVVWHQDRLREYRRCENCDLTYVPSAYHLSPTEEKAIYDQHENNPEDQGYRNFLSRLLEPLIKKLNQGSTGLDFGCGPGPCLSLMLEEQGFSTEIYDIYYANNPEVLNRKYDFITSTEVIEHLSNPKEIIEQLLSLLNPGGILGLMTKRTPKSQEQFSNWHYIKDPTHITFYSERTLAFIADKYNCRLDLPGPDTAILTKN